MRKFLKALGVAALLSLPSFGFVHAAVVTNTTDQLFNAVGEVSTTLTAAPFADLTVFVSGVYASGNTLVLQEEAGSPGSGIFRTVATITTATANSRITFGWTNGPNRNGYRLNMTATGTGAISAFMTDRSRTAVNYVNDGNQVIYYDEFFTPQESDTSATLVSPDFYVTETQSTSGGTIGAVTVTVQEGAVTLVSGDASSATDPPDESTCISHSVLADWAALVSDGWNAFETRIRIDVLTGQAAIGLIDIICVADNITVADIDSGAVTANGATATLVAIMQQDEADSIDTWQAVSAISNAEGSNGEEVVGPTAVAATYVVLMVEIDSLGNAYFYVDGQMFHAEALAALTTSRIIPYIQVSGTPGGTAVVTAVVDYWKFVQARPSG